MGFFSNIGHALFGGGENPLANVKLNKINAFDIANKSGLGDIAHQKVTLENNPIFEQFKKAGNAATQNAINSLMGTSATNLKSALNQNSIFGGSNTGSLLRNNLISSNQGAQNILGTSAQTEAQGGLNILNQMQNQKFNAANSLFGGALGAEKANAAAANNLAVKKAAIDYKNSQNTGLIGGLATSAITGGVGGLFSGMLSKGLGSLFGG